MMDGTLKDASSPEGDGADEDVQRKLEDLERAIQLRKDLLAPHGLLDKTNRGKMMNYKRQLKKFEEEKSN